MKKELGVWGLVVTSLLLTFFAIVLLFTSPYGVLQLFLFFVSFVIGVIAIKRSVREKSTSKIVSSILVAILPILVFLWAESLNNIRANQTGKEVDETLKYYKENFPIDIVK